MLNCTAGRLATLISNGPRRHEDGLAQLLAALERDLARTLSRFRIPAQDAEDLVQETLLLFLTKQAEVRDPGAWISTTLRNRCVVYWRRRRRVLVESFDETLIDSLASEAEPEQTRRQLARDLSSAISTLPARCRSILKLRYALGCEGGEVAERLGYRESSIRQVTNRCISALSVKMLAGGYRPEVSA